MRAFDQPLVRHVVEEFLERDLRISADCKGLRDFALAGRLIGIADEIQDLLARGELGGALICHRISSLHSRCWSRQSGRTADLLLRWTRSGDIGPKRSSRDCRSNRTFKPARRNRCNAEDPIVHPDMGKDRLARVRTLVRWNKPRHLPLITVGPPPAHLITRSAGDRRPGQGRVVADRSGHFGFRRRGSACNRSKRSDVQLCHFRKIGKIDMVDGVAVADVVFRSYVLVLPIVIFDRDADARCGITKG